MEIMEDFVHEASDANIASSLLYFYFNHLSYVMHIQQHTHYHNFAPVVCGYC